MLGRKGRIFFVVALVVAAALGVGHWPGKNIDAARRSVLYLETGCTATFVAPDVILTAAHCVREYWSWIYPLGREYRLVYMGEDGLKNRVMARLVWVSVYADEVRELRGSGVPLPGENDGLDIALLRTTDKWGSYVRIGANPEKGKGYEAWTTSFGVIYWRGDIEVLDVAELDSLGKVAVMRGNVYPGASGSLVIKGGLARAMITDGFLHTTPPVVFGAVADRISWALSDYEKKGPMRFCGIGICRKGED